jgi:hypothetical protein
MKQEDKRRKVKRKEEKERRKQKRERNRRQRENEMKRNGKHDYTFSRDPLLTSILLGVEDELEAEDFV